MRGVDHQLVGLSTLGSQRGEDTVEDAQAAPSNEAVIDRLVRPIVCRRIAPAKAVADHEDDTADNPLVINPGHPMRQRKMRLDPPHLRLRQPDQITHGSTLQGITNESERLNLRKLLIGPEPKITKLQGDAVPGVSMGAGSFETRGPGIAQ